MPRYALFNHDHAKSGAAVPNAGLRDMDMSDIQNGQVMAYDSELLRFRPTTIEGTTNPASAPAWGDITGSISAQGDLASALGGKANVGDLLPGPPGADGQDGYTPVKGVDYFDGEDSIVPGPPGADSIVPGPPGADGADGSTPVKGVDYFDGADSTVPGPPGADSTVPGPPGADSTVPGPKGDKGDPGEPGSDPWTIVKLASDFPTTNATNTNVTGLAFTPAINKTYYVLGTLMLRTATASVGARPGIAWPANLTDGTARVEASTALTTSVLRSWGAKTTQNAASTGLADTVSSHYSKLEALIVAGPTPSGNFQVTLASETAGTTVTMKAGSYIMYREI